ncbi:MAG: cupin-like domain-containing protein [Pseudomonadota bacterium]
MNIYDGNLEEIERVQIDVSEAVAQLLRTARRPLIFQGLRKDLGFFQSWDLNFLSNMNTDVPIMRPDADGVNQFNSAEFMPIRDVVENIKNGDAIYIGAKQITGEKGIRAEGHGLGTLAESLTIPDWIDKPRIYNTNLWFGGGNNTTLLHYDAWDSVMMLNKGEKEFVIFPSDQSEFIPQYSPLNLSKLAQGTVLSSKIKPLNIQPKYRAQFQKAKGFRATLKPGEVIFVPAGCWHFVQSSGINMAVNFFLYTASRRIHLQEPLRTFWIKDNITVPPVVVYRKARAGVAKLSRLLSSLASSNQSIQ